jgi:hypothetical protein
MRMVAPGTDTGRVIQRVITRSMHAPGRGGHDQLGRLHHDGPVESDLMLVLYLKGLVEQPVPRMTMPTQLVLRALLAEPAQEMYGLQICQAAGLPSGTIHPILARLEGLGWLESRWEDASPQE